MSQATPSESSWGKMSDQTRRTVVWTLWFVTWIGLLAGLVDRKAYEFVVLFSVAHAFLFLVLHSFRVAAFPVQVRIAYVLWVLIGTYIPYMVFFMYITTVGLVGNLFFKYCPLARMLYLLPWNREETFSFNLLTRAFLTPPVEGRFRPTPPAT